jgi:GT2 family glycosyltransferase
MNPRISIIILNWNGWRDTVECLESLYQISYSSYDVIVLDNGSGDNSLESLKRYSAGDLSIGSKFFESTTENRPIKILEYTKGEAELGGGRENEIADLPTCRKLVLIRNDMNYGFAEGNNIGIRYALKALNPDYILLLNNDVVVKRDFLDLLTAALENDEGAGFAGPAIYYYDYNGHIDILSTVGIDLIMRKGWFHRIGNFEQDRGQYNAVTTVDFLEGSCLLIKKALDKIGLFDSGYFAYWEETDLCIRGREAGYKCICVPTAKIWHKVSSSAPKGVKLYYMTRNRLWFVKDHATKKELRSFLAYFFGRQFWIILRDYVYQKDMKSISIFLKGVLHGILPKRKLD